MPATINISSTCLLPRKFDALAGTLHVVRQTECIRSFRHSTSQFHAYNTHSNLLIHNVSIPTIDSEHIVPLRLADCDVQMELLERPGVGLRHVLSSRCDVGLRTECSSQPHFFLLQNNDQRNVVDQKSYVAFSL